MNPEEVNIRIGQYYLLKEGLSPSFERWLAGTNRVAYCVDIDHKEGIRSGSPLYCFRVLHEGVAKGMWLTQDKVKCWMPRIGEKALFWNDMDNGCRLYQFAGYAGQHHYPFKVGSSGGAYLHCKPLNV